jgi:hypothetical protein
MAYDGKSTCRRLLVFTLVCPEGCMRTSGQMPQAWGSPSVSWAKKEGWTAHPSSAFSLHCFFAVKFWPLTSAPLTVRVILAGVKVYLFLLGVIV